MDVLHPELFRVVRDLDLAQEPKALLLQALAHRGNKIATKDAIDVLWLLRSLRCGGIQCLNTPQKALLMGNLVSLMRRGQKEWVGKVCHLLYEGNPGPLRASCVFPEGMIKDLLRWVHGEKAERVREIVWAVLLRREAGSAGVASIADMVAGLFEKDPFTRNNVIRFLFEQFPPNEVADFVLKKILTNAELGERERDQIYSDTMNSMNRFDLIKLLYDAGGRLPSLVKIRLKGEQMGLPLDYVKTAPCIHEGFRHRISLLMRKPDS